MIYKGLQYQQAGKSITYNYNQLLKLLPNGKIVIISCIQTVENNEY